MPPPVQRVYMNRPTREHRSDLLASATFVLDDKLKAMEALLKRMEARLLDAIDQKASESYARDHRHLDRIDKANSHLSRAESVCLQILDRLSGRYG